VTAETLQVIPLAQLIPSGFNPRKTFDEAMLRELADSIKAKGLLQPILVRPRPGPAPKKGPVYEIAAGERRWRAAQLAGLTAIEAKVRELTDQDVLEIAVIENEQREDVTPLEKAEGYQALVDLGVSVEQIAAKVGKAESTVRDLLRLRNLPEKARKALEAGTLLPSVAGLIAGRPSEAMRKKVAAMACSPWRGQDQPSYRDVREYVQRECMIELKQAPFSQKEKDLTGAGACTDCPKRTGNNRADYPDGRADVCTDPACFRDKVDAHQKRLVATYKAEGKTVLEGKAAKTVFDEYQGTRVNSEEYVDLDTTCNDYRSPAYGKTYRKLLGKEAAEQTVLAHDAKGTLHHLLDKKTAMKLLKEKHGGKDKEESATDAKYRQQAAEDRKKVEIGKAAALLANGRVAEQMHRAAAGIAGWTGQLTLALRAVAMLLPEILWTDACRRVRQRRNLPSAGDDRAVVRAEANELETAPELLALIAELVAARASENWGSLYYGGDDAERKAFWQAWDISHAKMQKEAAEQRKAAREEKQAAKKNSKARASRNGHAKAPIIEPDLEKVLGAERDAAENGDPLDVPPCPHGIGPVDACEKCTPIAAAPARPPITRDTWLNDLLTGKDVYKLTQAIDKAGLMTVGDLIDKAARHPHKAGMAQRLWATLHGINRLTAKGVKEIGDAVMNSGLLEREVVAQ
jgi:ParB/RepB/Spo0J family partition protein